MPQNEGFSKSQNMFWKNIAKVGHRVEAVSKSQIERG